MKNYYEEKIAEIEELMKNDLEKAFFALKTELEMPYIPEIYEPKFRSLFRDARIQLMDDTSQKKLSYDEIIKYLWSDNTLHEAIAINNLREMNMRNYADELKKWIEAKPASKNISKTFIYELLCTQEVDVDIRFKNTIVNPKKNKSLFNDPEVKKALLTGEKLIDKDPNIAKLLVEEIERYLLIAFPIKVKNGELLANQILNVILQMFGNNIILSQEEKSIAKLMNGIN